MLERAELPAEAEIKDRVTRDAELLVRDEGFVLEYDVSTLTPPERGYFLESLNAHFGFHPEKGLEQALIAGDKQEFVSDRDPRFTAKTLRGTITIEINR